jgi:hypothetical protein
MGSRGAEQESTSTTMVAYGHWHIWGAVKDATGQRRSETRTTIRRRGSSRRVIPSGSKEGSISTDTLGATRSTSAIRLGSADFQV